MSERGPGKLRKVRPARHDDEDDRSHRDQHPVHDWQSSVGNRAVASLLALNRMPVQRWAWVADTRVQPDEPGLDPAMKAFAEDRVVRDYTSRAEFTAHAAGSTDYLGNLPGPFGAGTWVRFSPTGTNLVGENHTEVTLEEVVRAVGSTNFIYEPLSVDQMAADSGIKAAYEQENQDRFARMGVAQDPDKRKFGAESLFPKMGFGLNLILPWLRSGTLNQLKAGGYVGQPAQRYLKIAWGYAKDVPGEVAALTTATQPVPPALANLAQVQAAVAGDLDPFVTGLVVDGYLGNALDTPAGLRVVPALITFCEAFVAAMLARAGTDPTMTGPERAELSGMPAGTGGEKDKVFAKWRNLHFSHAVRDAAARGVRYAGMGRAHLDYLTQEGIPPNSRPYDMTGRDFAVFDLLTKARIASMSGGRP